MNEMTFDALFEHSSMGIIFSNEAGVIEKANPWASKIFGYGHGELIGQSIEVLIPPHLRERHVQYRRHYNANPQPRGMGSNLNLMAVKKDGSLFPVEISLTYFGETGKRHIVSFVNDITERKRAENDLRRLTEELESKVTERTKELSDALLELGHTNEGLQQEMEQRKRVEEQLRGMWEREKELSELKSRFVSMASHEFRTPLAGILTSVSLIAKYPRTEDEPKRDKHVQSIKRSVKNLTAILNDFLSLDKLDQGKVAASPVAFDAAAFINETVQEAQETGSGSHPLEVEGEGRLDVVMDKDMLRNVLVNLLSNAFKYSPDGKPITVAFRGEGDRLVLDVRDRGMGIPLDEQKHLFERFFRATNVINLQGTGLGLNIVKRYLDLMKGEISFTSVPGEGTTFTVTLPRGQA